ncbi:MAG: hypothetical protein WB580_13000 [Candidatus Binataceae bacterium]
MSNFEELVIKILKDSTFADQFHDPQKRADALRTIGINPDHPGLEDALDMIDYRPLKKVRDILDPANTHKQN